MVYYETLLLADPSITQDEVKSIETALTTLSKSKKSSMISFEKWGKYLLAYPVKKNPYGVYLLARFESEEASSLPKEIATLCKVKLSNTVMRDMTTRLAKNASLSYEKPPSLEDEPSAASAGSVKTFLRENNMEGLMSSVDDKKEVQKVASDQIAEVEKISKEAVSKEESND